MSGFRSLALVIAVVTLGLGVALLAVTAANGGGETGYLIGALFLAVGVGRLYLVRARRR